MSKEHDWGNKLEKSLKASKEKLITAEEKKEALKKVVEEAREAYAKLKEKFK